MTKLFFDIVGPEQRHLDFSGRLFSSADEAGEAAQLMSLDLGITENSTWDGSEDQVKDEAGRCMFSYTVGKMK